jgi:hypothetical protein
MAETSLSATEENEAQMSVINAMVTVVDTLVPLLYQCVETRSIEFSLLSQSLLHLRLNLFVISETFATQL